MSTNFLLMLMTKLWDKMPNVKPLRVGVTVCGLSTEENHQPDLFDMPKAPNLMKAIDSLNGKFGRGTVGFDTTVPTMGSKIAFSRVPEANEF